MIRRNRPAIGTLIVVMFMVMLGIYFTFAALQGDYGILARAEINGQVQDMTVELAALTDQVAEMENLTRRLSDDYLDLDLLDQQARDVLGLIRADEIVIR